MSAEEGTPPPAAELAGLKLSALKKRAKQVGVDEDKLEAADDADDVKAAVIAMIVEQEGTAQPVCVEAELAGMKLSSLKKRAKEVGVDEQKLEEADDADDVKAAVIALIVGQEREGKVAELRAELDGMKLSALKKRAKEVGVDKQKLEEADDADDVKAAVIALIVGQLADAEGSDHSDPTAEEAARQQEDARKLRKELGDMKLSVLKKRAKEDGVDEVKLEEADDADDTKSAVIELIMEKLLEAQGGGAADQMAELEAQREAERQKLRKELGDMKLSVLKKRAKEDGVDEVKLEEADDADDTKSAVIELIMDRAREDRDRPSQTAVRPHFAAEEGGGGGSKAEYLQGLFGTKHCMFSYVSAIARCV